MDTQERRAVLVGINRQSRATPLEGCVNDVLDMRALLI